MSRQLCGRHIPTQQILGRRGSRERMERTGLWRMRLLLETMFEIWQLVELDVQSSFACVHSGFPHRKAELRIRSC